jgi:raffinose/stachyose/melibiose transport system substrate-binding protein
MRLFEYLLEKNAGPELHDALLAGEASWDDPAVVQSFTEFKEWEEKGWLPEGVMGLDPAQEEPGFTQGKSAYTIAGGWADSAFVQAAADPSDYGVFKLPTDQEPSRASGWVEGYMINEASPNKDDAAKLLEWLSRPADAAELPLTAEVTEIAANSPFYTIQDQAFPAELSNTYFEIQSQVLQGQLSPEDAAKQMQEAVPAGLEKK